MSNHDKVTKEGISEDEMDELDVVLAAMRHHATQLGEAFELRYQSKLH